MAYQANGLALGSRPRGAAGVLFRLHGGGRGGVWGSPVGAGGPLLQTESEEGILSVGLEPKRERRCGGAMWLW